MNALGLNWNKTWFFHHNERNRLHWKYHITKHCCKNSKHKLWEIELTMFREILRKLNWVVWMTRPDISFIVCETSARVKNASNLIPARLSENIKFIQINMHTNIHIYLCTPLRITQHQTVLWRKSQQSTEW